MKNIVQKPGGFEVKIRLYGRLRSFGTYDTLPEAVTIRNSIMSNHRQGLKLEHKPTDYGVKGNRARFVFEGERIDLGICSSPLLAAAAVNAFFVKHGRPPPNRVDQEKVNQQRASSLAELSRQKREARMKIKQAKGPEWYIQQRIIKYLRDRQWKVKVMAAHKFMWAVPDLLASHRKEGPRFIEVKNPENFSFTDAQTQEFPQWISHGLPIYVLCEANQENYDRLFKESNLWLYMGGFNDGK